MNIHGILRNFVISNLPGAIVLQGDWGVGKTFLWNRAVTTSHPKTRPSEAYAYVSLFGINSLDSMKAAVAYATSASEAAELGNQSWTRRLRQLGRKFRGWLPWAAAAVPSKLGGGTGLAQAINALTFYLVRNRLICIDDIERRGKDLSLVDCLGLVSFLVEQRECRVCVILNAGQLSAQDAETWAMQREKVFVSEVTYKPETRESVELGLVDTTEQPWHMDATGALMELEIKNVRLIRRMVRLLTLVFQAVPPPSTAAVRRMVRDIIFLEFAHSGRALKAPPLDFVMKNGATSFVIDRILPNHRKADVTAEERDWATLIQSYAFDARDELGKALYSAVTTGFPDPDRLRRAIAEIEGNQVQADAKHAFHAAWRLYHDYVTENDREAIEAITSTWPAVSPHEHVSNLFGVVNMLRRVGRTQLASDFIDQWLGQRAEERIHELDLRELSLFEPIDDTEFLAKLEQVRASHQPIMLLSNALATLGRHEYAEDAIASIARAQAAELVSALEDNPGEHLSVAITQCLKLTEGHEERPTWTGAGSRMREALFIIARRSPWSADRVRRKYGIELSPEPTDDSPSAARA